jgi:hypothetical protein
LARAGPDTSAAPARRDSARSPCFIVFIKSLFSLPDAWRVKGEARDAFRRRTARIRSRAKRSPAARGQPGFVSSSLQLAAGVDLAGSQWGADRRRQQETLIARSRSLAVDHARGPFRRVVDAVPGALVPFGLHVSTPARIRKTMRSFMALP